VIRLRNVALRRGEKLLLQNADLMVHAGQKLGVVGPNGCGKTSLFAVLCGELHADAGDVEVPASWLVSRVEQEVEASERQAIEFVLDGDVELRAAEAGIEAADRSGDGERMAAAHQHYEELGGWSAKARAAVVLDGLGFRAEEFERPVAAFSGGFRVRLNLARALMRRADLMLLDEPTNHLDLDAVIWLEEWLSAWSGTLFVISHDREFLDATVSSVLHFDNGGLKLYAGGYSDFERQRAQALAQQQAAWRKQQREIEHLRSYIERFRAKATKARQAQSRIKALARMETIAAAHVDSPFAFHFRDFPASPDPVLVLDGAAAGYGGSPVLSGVSLSIQAGSRLGLLGRNGAGKSTLVKLIAGALAPMAGDRIEGKGLRIGYFAQHQLEALDLEASPLLHLARIDRRARAQVLRDHLGGFGFPGDMALSPVAAFSGGERARLALAIIIWQRPNLLLLDEPTNHLDIDMREALTEALLEYEGALVLVSHDRHLVRTTADALLLVEDGRVSPYEGDLDDYRTLLRSRRQRPASAPAAMSRREERRLAAEARQARSQQRKPLLARLERLERDLGRRTRDLARVEVLLASENIYGPEQRDQLAGTVVEQSQVRADIERLEAEWIRLHEDIERLALDA
jgi:ATP-binding cassette subfamily F protein 3